MLRDSLAGRRAFALGYLMLSTVLAAGIITAREQSTVELPHAAIAEAAASSGSLPGETQFVGRISEARPSRDERNPPAAREDGGLRQPISEGEIGIARRETRVNALMLTRPTKHFPRLANSRLVGKPLARFAARKPITAADAGADFKPAPRAYVNPIGPIGLDRDHPVAGSAENDEASEPVIDEPLREPLHEPLYEPSPAVVLSDPFNAAAPVAVEPPRGTQAESVDDYLFAAYQRLAEKRDSSGDFTWKDIAAAARMGLSLEDYVIGGMDADFKELIYAAGKQMDAAGIQWSILSAFRDDWRQQIASGFKASAQNSCHGGSLRVGGYGYGHCVDLWTADGPVEAVFAWIDRAGAAVALARPMPGRDPAHVQPVGDWRAMAERLRTARLTGPMIAAVRDLGGADTAAGLTELAGGSAPVVVAATLPPSEGRANERQTVAAYAMDRPRLDRPRLVLAQAESHAALRRLAALRVAAAVRVRAALDVHKLRRNAAIAAAAPRPHAHARLSGAIRGARHT
jgi:hypothetical protein